MDDVEQVIYNSASHKLLADALRGKVDALNDALADCARAGMSVMVEVIDASVGSDNIVRSVVRVEPHVVLRY